MLNRKGVMSVAIGKNVFAKRNLQPIVIMRIGNFFYNKSPNQGLLLSSRKTKGDYSTVETLIMLVGKCLSMGVLPVLTTTLPGFTKPLSFKIFIWSKKISSRLSSSA